LPGAANHKIFYAVILLKWFFVEVNFDFVLERVRDF